MPDLKDKAAKGMGQQGACANSSAGASGIKERMDVYASCGTKMGVVDHLEGDAIKLTKSDSPDGQHHFLPTNWVSSVRENRVELTKNSEEVARGWKNDAASCASCSA